MYFFIHFGFKTSRSTKYYKKSKFYYGCTTDSRSNIPNTYLLFKHLKWLVTKKFNLFVGFPPCTRFFFWFITCTYKRPSLRLFRFKIYQFVPNCMKIRKIHFWVTSHLKEILKFPFIYHFKTPFTQILSRRNLLFKADRNISHFWKR